jgi:uncharacterized membrane protein YciS (DUF1049 family)
LTNNNSKRISLYYFFSIVIFLIGYGFYIVVRGFDPILIVDVGDPVWSVAPLFIKNSFATFTHVLAFALFSYALLGVKPYYKFRILLFWSVLNIIFELVQLPLFTDYFATGLFAGTFDISDLLAILFAAMVFYVLTSLVDSKFFITSSVKNKVKKRYSYFGLSLTMVAGIGSIMACGGYDQSYQPYTPDVPIYMSYDELRAPLTIDFQRKLQESGKIYIYQDLLLVSEPNKGVHIYDNTAPATPIHKAFIKLPGNLDVAVRNGYLYADSFIDLVIININDLNNIYEISRVESVFPYDPYQTVPVDDRTFYQWDKSKGVIIGVKQNSSTALDKKIFI